ncbi:uncharacterized protein LOC105438115 [Strongylocentrotus purpuratus]|uniref:SET domain-containing protein n=1 Tax=Strongylocentrotus purpuratus TaxID=7668 RepID=A0A7M7NTL5_STRPU|nr:uncharacterized protein LOC105438115 [Strongylocentrotus purpuratus]
MASGQRKRPARIPPHKVAKNWCVLGKDQSGFTKTFIKDDIGYGLVTTRPFFKGNFLLEYRGDLTIAPDEDEENVDYVFHFSHNNTKYRIDASEEDSCLARWVNDDHIHPNCVIKKVTFNQSSGSSLPHLCLFALVDIRPGAELRYDYGVDNLPWRQEDAARQRERETAEQLVNTAERKRLREEAEWEAEKRKREERVRQEEEEQRRTEEEEERIRDLKIQSQSYTPDSEEESEEEFFPRSLRNKTSNREINSNRQQKKVAPVMVESDSEINSNGKRKLVESEGDIKSNRKLGKKAPAIVESDSDKEDEPYVAPVMVESDSEINSNGKRKLVESDGDIKSNQKLGKKAPAIVESDSDKEDEPYVAPVMVESDSEINSNGKRKLVESDGDIKSNRKLGKKAPAIVESDSDKEDEPYVAASNTKPNGPRKWDSYSYCLYCGKKQSQLKRHLLRKHTDESMVAEAQATVDDNRKTQIWSKIKKLGDFEHNQKVHIGEAMDLKVTKRPKYKAKYDVNDYVPCSYCYGYYHIHSLYIHRKNCKAKDGSKNNATNKNMHVKSGRALIPMKHSTTSQCRRAVDSMGCNDISLIIKNDQDILGVGQNHLGKSNSAKKEETCREKMRTVAKILQAARSIDTSIVNASDMLTPSKFDTVVKASLFVSKYDEGTQKHGAYSTALKLGPFLKVLVVVVRGKYSRQHMEDHVKTVNEFERLLVDEWNIHVTSSALQQRTEKNWKNPRTLPLTQDVVKFNKYLAETEKEIKTDIEEAGMSPDLYRDLANVTLAQIVTYNRRRPGEVERMKVDEYREQITKTDICHDEIFKTLTMSEKAAMNRLKMVKVRGKRGRGVPVFLTENTKQSVDMIIDYHDQRQRDDEPRRYIFSRACDTASTPYRACDAMKTLTDKADLIKPENVRCTRLRKHIATTSQLLNLNDHELEQLANMMGHDVRIHREYYRLPQDVLLLAKASKLLTISAKGEMHKYAGKSLEEIERSPDDTVDLDETDQTMSGDTQTEYSDEETGPRDVDKSPGVNDAETVVSDSEESEVFEEVSRRTQAKVKRVGRKYNRWTDEQTQYLKSREEVKKMLKTKTVPGKLVGLQIIQKSKGLLKDKNWKEVKFKVHTLNQLERKRLQKKEKMYVKK